MDNVEHVHVGPRFNHLLTHHSHNGLQQSHQRADERVWYAMEQRDLQRNSDREGAEEGGDT